MRKADKKKAEEFVQLLKMAHTEIKEMLEIKNQAAALDLLEQCQSSVIRLGEIIEYHEGEDFATIPLLEEYCELDYQIYEEIRQNHQNGSKVYKILNKALIRIENSIRNDIHARTEAVFLPYKASMWDSLESIWKAADEDPDCDAYVIPIPYYDRNPDGSFREMHYEGDQYPDDVPITDYNKYDFANRRPDMIFIHNPYDDCNFVTSVPPFFYSKNLKQFTDKLVYVPYFILGEVEPEDEEQVKGMEHFCTVPGVIYADQVIVQSEKMREVYIQVLNRYARKDMKKYWEDKILGLGSPKVDKVLSTKVEDLEFPEEWKKILEKSDGNCKKVILYNTSVSALLQHKEKMLEKIRYVLQKFYENRNEVALLWRPHPLIKATIKSMCPQLWLDYKKIVETYRDQDWGIYDDSVYMDRTLIISDAYYGDGSSLIQLYEKTGKPIMIQNVGIKRNKIDNIRYLYSEAIWYGEKQIWLSAMEFNGLYRYDFENNKTIFIGSFPNEANNEWRLHGKAVKVSNEIYFLPNRSKYVHVYNIETNELLALDMKIDGRILCQNGFHDEGKIYFLCGKPTIMVSCIDIATKEIKKHKIEIENYKSGISTDIVILNNKLYFTCLDSDIIIEYSYKTDKYKQYHLGEDLKGLGTICHDGNAFWISGKNKVIRWNKEKSEIKSFCDFPEGFGMCIRLNMTSEKIVSVKGFADAFSKSEHPFAFSAFLGGKVWLFPHRVNMIVCINIQTGDMKEFYLQGEQEDKESLLLKHRNTHCHYRGGLQGNLLAFFSTKSKKFRVIQQNGMICKELYIKCEEPDDMFSYLIGDEINFRFEDEDLNNLEEFLTIKNKKNIRNNGILNDQNIGKLIYKQIN